MSFAALVVSLITLVGSLFLAIRGFKSHGVTFERGALMAAVWCVVIVVVAFVATRMGV